MIKKTKPTKPKFDIDVQLSGRDGNAFIILGAVQSAMRKAGASKEDIEAYANEAMSGDYNHLLAVTFKTVNVI